MLSPKITMALFACLFKDFKGLFVSFRENRLSYVAQIGWLSIILIDWLIDWLIDLDAQSSNMPLLKNNTALGATPGIQKCFFVAVVVVFNQVGAYLRPRLHITYSVIHLLSLFAFQLMALGYSIADLGHSSHTASVRLFSVNIAPPTCHL